MRISDWSSDACSSDLHLAVERGKPLEAPVEAVEEGHERSRQGDRRSDGNGGNRCQSQAASRFRCGSTIIQRRRCGASPLDHALPQSSCSLCLCCRIATAAGGRSEEHTSELQSLMRISSAVLCLKKKKNKQLQQDN